MTSETSHTTSIMSDASRLDRLFFEYRSGLVMAKYRSMDMAHRLSMDAVHRHTSSDTQMSHINRPNVHVPATRRARLGTRAAVPRICRGFRAGQALPAPSNRPPFFPPDTARSPNNTYAATVDRTGPRARLSFWDCSTSSPLERPRPQKPRRVRRVESRECNRPPTDVARAPYRSRVLY